MESETDYDGDWPATVPNLIHLSSYNTTNVDERNTVQDMLAKRFVSAKTQMFKLIQHFSIDILIFERQPKLQLTMNFPGYLHTITWKKSEYPERRHPK